MALRSRKQIDNAGDRFRELREGPGDRELVQEYRQFRCLELPRLLSKISGLARIQPCLVATRAKRTDTIIRKLRRQNNMGLTYMGDILGFRVLCPSPEVQRVIVGRIETDLERKDVKDYCGAPTPAGYRGYHFEGSIMQTIPGATKSTRFTYEIQVRTYYQHLWATESESYGEQVKEGGGTAEQREYLLALSSRIHEFETANPGVEQVHWISGAERTFWTVINFDKDKGLQIGEPMPFLDLDTALQYYEYLENRFTEDLSKEIVMLGSPDPDASISHTHLRYWMLRGRPGIPADIQVDFARPTGRQ